MKGIMNSFQAIASARSAPLGYLTIAEALFATIIGRVVAILSVSCAKIFPENGFS